MAEESGALPMPAPRLFSRTYAIMAFGPLIGGLVVYLVLMAMTAPWSGSDVLGALWLGAVLYIGFGWAVGLAPAAASALLWHYLGMEARPLPWRIAAALLIGAATSVVLTWPPIAFLTDNLTPGYLFTLLSMPSGALALLLTTLLPLEQKR